VSSRKAPLRLVTQVLTSVLNVVGGLPDPFKEAATLTVAFTAAVGLGVFAYTRAKAALASLGTTLGVVTAEETAAGDAALLTNTRMQAIRGRSAAVGIGLLTLQSSLQRAHGGFSSLAGIAGDAALGSSVGGPWGARSVAQSGSSPVWARRRSSPRPMCRRLPTRSTRRRRGHRQHTRPGCQHVAAEREQLLVTVHPASWRG
jgi:hypothetical protein